MDNEFLKKLYEQNQSCGSCPSRPAIGNFISELISFLFPEYHKETYTSFRSFQLFADKLKVDLELIVNNHLKEGVNADGVVEQFFEEIPDLYEIIFQDISAMYDGDPAARSHTEVIRSYPGFFAISSFRIANKLKKLGVLLVPRIITELAHSQTGIDIHPGADIGRYFCIDHGTGVVIGETSVIGNRVKIYQGVTLGGLSVDKTEADQKRHPTIEDDVVIYAGATILGGETVIGKNSIIGGNVWLTRSVPPETKVYYKAALTDESGETDMIEFK
jgi:serine O-acetyltransferase